MSDHIWYPKELLGKWFDEKRSFFEDRRFRIHTELMNYFKFVYGDHRDPQEDMTS